MNDKIAGGLEPGRTAAVTCLVMGVLAAACMAASLAGMAMVFSLLALAFSIIGLVEASKAKGLGYCGALRTVGFSLCLLSLILGALTVLMVLLTVAALVG